MHVAIELETIGSASPSSLQMPRTSDIPQSCGARSLASLRSEYARLSARAAQARGRGEWALAAQIAAQITYLHAGLLSAQRC